MNPNLETAIIQFLADEFHLAPENILPDTDFITDIGLTEDQLADLITRIQDALEFVLPEDKTPAIRTVGDLLSALHPDEPPPTV